MKQIRFDGPGAPEQVVYCTDVAPPEISAPDEVIVDIDAFQINPADLLTLQGFYPAAGQVPGSLGNEATGHVAEVGASVESVKPGDRVILLTIDNWSEQRCVKAHQVVRVPKQLDRLDLAGLKVNPATAALLLDRFVDLQPGDWVMQNASNSAVGRALITIAKERGLNTVNVVRSDLYTSQLNDLGATLVLTDGDDLAERAATGTREAPIRLALDAVAGAATGQLASCLAEEGQLVVYGALSGMPIDVDPTAFVFKDIAVRGFWLTKLLVSADAQFVEPLYNRLAKVLLAGHKFVAVDSAYSMDDIKSAIERATQSEGGHKVLVTIDR